MTLSLGIQHWDSCLYSVLNHPHLVSELQVWILFDARWIQMSLLHSILGYNSVVPRVVHLTWNQEAMYLGYNSMFNQENGHVIAALK